MKLNIDLSNLGSIPKLIHVSWKNKDVLSSNHSLIKYGLNKIKSLNPDYKLIISDDQDVDEYLKANLKKWDYLKIKNKKIVEKLDLWRLLKIYNEGGIYLDIDRYCNIGFDEIIQPQTKCILPTHKDVDFSQDIMISCKHNPIFKKAIELNLQGRFLINPRGVFHLGPPLYMKAITKTLFGEASKRNPGVETMNQYRELLNESSHFQTHRESMPYDTLIFNGNGNDSIINYENDKSAFYDSQSIVPWNKGIDKNTAILIFLILIVALVITTTRML